MLLFSVFRDVLHVSVCFCTGNFVKMHINLTLTTLFAKCFEHLFNWNTENMQWLIKLFWSTTKNMFIRKIIKKHVKIYARQRLRIETNECVIGKLASDQMKPLDMFFCKVQCTYLYWMNIKCNVYWRHQLHVSGTHIWFGRCCVFVFALFNRMLNFVKMFGTRILF